MKKIITEDGEIVDVDSPGNDCDECTVFYKTPHNHNRNAESDRVALTCNDKSLTDQSFKDDADINIIMERALRTKQIPMILSPQFADTTQLLTQFEMRSRIAENNATFYKLSADIRAEFQNDPAQWEKQVLQDLLTGDDEHLRLMGIEPPPRPPVEPPAGNPAPAAPEGAGTPVPAPKGP